MIEQVKGTLWIKLALATACVVLAWMLYNLMSGPGRSPDTGPVPAASLPDPRSLTADLSYAMPPMSKFDAILRRPIFSPNRRAIGGTAVIAVSQELDLRITGTVVTERERYAMVLPRGGEETLTLREGEDYRGWTVSQVHVKGVVFERGGSQEEVLLDYEVAPEVPKPRDRRKATSRRQATPQVRQNPTPGEDDAPEPEKQEGGDS